MTSPTRSLSRLLALGSCIALTTTAYAQITIDGTLDPDYGSALAVQLAPTGFGDNNDADVLSANGSELNAAYAVIRDGHLHLFLAGNLQTNFNKLEIFIDSVDFGENTLGSDNPDVDFNGLNAMAGLTFDFGIGMDYYLTLSGGDSGSGVEFFLHFADLFQVGGSGTFLGGTGPGNSTWPTTLTDVDVGLNNSNTGGVNASDASNAGSVATGIELKIPLSRIGNPTGPIKICAFINNDSHSFLSNQVLGSLPADYSNLGAPASINFENNPTPTQQFFTVVPWRVTNTADSGAGSLRQTIADAPAGSTITFDPALSGQTITLGGTQLLIDKDLTIDASAVTGGLTIDANNDSRHFYINLGRTVTLDSLTLIGGNESDNGGSIYNDRATLTLIHSIIRDNNADGLGGGIYSDGGAVEFVNAGSAAVTLNSSTVENNTAMSGGGIYSVGKSFQATGLSTVTLNDSIILNNDATDSGGGIYNDGFRGQAVLIVNRSLLSDNTTGVDGGGIYSNGKNSGSALGNATLTMNDSTLENNYALGDGGAIFSNGHPGNSTVSISNSTLTANSADRGGCIFNDGLNSGSAPGNAELTLSNATLSNNTALTAGGGIYSAGSATGISSLTLNNTVLAGNNAPDGPDLKESSAATIVSVEGKNLFSDLGGNSLSAPNSAIIVAGNPMLAPLGDYGGPTQTMRPLLGSPAIDAAGNTDPGGTDQRGTPRFANSALDIGAVEFQLAVVDTNIDENDSPEGPALSLREAIEREFVDTIIFDPALDSATITLTSGQLTIDKDLNINASGLAGGLTIDAHGSSRAFEVTLGAAVTMDSLTIAGGSETEGGGIYNGGTLTINQSTISGNIAELGGGISNSGGLTINQSTISENSADLDSGGGIYNEGVLTLNQSTLSGNSAGSGGGIFNELGGNLILENSIVAGNSASLAPNIFGSVNEFNGVNLDGGDPLLAPLGDYGGPTQTMAPLPGSPAIDAAGAIDPGGTDQRGFSRFVNGFLDIGAVEVGGPFSFVAELDGESPADGATNVSLNPTLSWQAPTSAEPSAYQVFLDGSPIGDPITENSYSFDDSLDSNTEYTLRVDSIFGDISATGPERTFTTRASSVVDNVNDPGTSGDGSTTLRQAIASADPGATITFDPSLNGGVITLTSGQLLIDKDLNIDASGLSSGLTISGNNASRVFEIASSASGSLDSLSLVAGSADPGGAVLNYGTLVMNRSTISGNSADVFGGGLYNDGSSGGSASMTLNSCTIADNSSSVGGGIYNDGRNGSAILTLNQSTVSGNNAFDYGGGLFNDASPGTAILNLNNSVVAGNIISAFGTGRDINNTTSPGTVGPLQGVNLLSDLTGSGLSAGAALLVDSPKLAPLGDYGGPTQTMPPQPGSPAIDAAGTTDPGGTDQRGAPRFVGSALDIGAVEFQPAVVTTNADENNSPEGAELSLREAIAREYVSTITFDLALSSQTITLGGTELLIDKDLTIDASALPGGLTVDGNDQSRIFFLTSSANLEIEALAMTRGNGSGLVADGFGGAVLNEGQFTATNCQFFDNSADLDGGAISGQMRLVNCTLTGNSARNGGAVVSGGDSHITNCTISDNFAASGIGGGGIYNYSGTLTLNQATLSGNSAPIGGGIYNLGSLTVNQATLSDNSATFGGGIFNDGTLTLNQATLSGNSADFGGGIYNNGTLTLNQATISENSAFEGGGIYNFGTLTLNQATISGNSADFDGGGIYNDFGTLTLNQAIVANNAASSIGPDIDQFGSYGSNSGVNFIGNTNGAGTIPGTILTGAPLLAPLGDYGGTTQTMPPLPGSPAIDAGVNTELPADQNDLDGDGDTSEPIPFDQRGMPRVVDGDANGSALVDIGAVESLRGADLDGFDFSEYDLSNVHLSGASLLGAVLSSNDLSSTTLTDARYNLSTQFPSGFVLSSSGMLGLLTQSELATLDAASVANVTNDPTSFGLYDESNVQDLAFGRPLFGLDSETGKFVLRFELQESPDLETPWAPLEAMNLNFNATTKEIEAEFDPPNADAYFYRLNGNP